MARSVRILALFLVLSACKTEPEAPARLSLDAVLGVDEVRAGQITDKDGQLPGINAKAGPSDFKIYNRRIAVTIADVGNGLGFNPYGGTLLDADIIRHPQVPTASVFGEIIWSLDFSVLQTESVEVVSDGSQGEARIRSRGKTGPLPFYDAMLGGLFGSGDLPVEWQIDYVLEPDSSVLRIEHQLFNTGRTAIEASPLIGFFFGTGARPFFEDIGFASSNSGAASPYYAAASDEVSYLFAQPDVEVSAIFGESGIAVANVGPPLKVRARERLPYTQYLWIGDGDLAKTRAQWRQSQDEPMTVFTGQVVDGQNRSVPGAHVHVLEPQSAGAPKYLTRALSNGTGHYRIESAGAPRALVATTADGRMSAQTMAGDNATLRVPTAAALTLDIRDEAGAPLPAKVSLRRSEGSGPTIPAHFGESQSPSGFDQIIFSIPSEPEVQLTAGTYSYYVSRGIEYEVVQGTIDVSADTKNTLQAVMVRSVDSQGWMTSDPHLHAQRSPDSSDSYELKVRALAAENIELPVSTDHEAVGDFNPAIAAAGLEVWLKGIVGTEISTTRYGHFNAFPMDQRPERIDWYGKNPEGFLEATHALPGQPVVQVNHPRSATIGYFELMDLDRGSFEGKADLTFGFDGIEVINECGDGSLDRVEVLDWFAFMSRGDRYFATGTMDDHTALRGRIGVPLTYVAVDGAGPQDVSPQAFRDAHARGELVVTCGPFIDAQIQGQKIGSLARSDDGRIEAQVSVSAPTWVDVDEVLLIVGGEVVATADVDTATGGLRFSGTLSATVAAGQDTWAIIWVRGDEPHGPWAQGRPSFGFTNAVFIDGDGDGAYY